LEDPCGKRENEGTIVCFGATRNCYEEGKVEAFEGLIVVRGCDHMCQRNDWWKSETL